MPPATSTTCPNCHAALSPGSHQCSVCKLEVSKMAAFAAAKRAARERGIKTTTIETREAPAWRSPGTIVKVVLLLCVLAGVGWMGLKLFGPEPPRYMQFPPTAQEAVQEFLRRIAAGDASHAGAYTLMADAARRPGEKDEEGDYRQIFHVLNNYLSDEFGGDWISRTKLAPDPLNPDVIIVTVALETLHIRTAQQVPKELAATLGSHVGILGIDEIDVRYAADLRQMGAIRNILEGVAGQGAVNNLDTITGARAANRNQPPFIRKIGLLEVLRNPRASTWQSVIQADPLRTDPVIQGRLRMITGDDRYELNVRQAAQRVLDDKVTEEERTSVGL